jgi:predicted nucleotidyltransferase
MPDLANLLFGSYRRDVLALLLLHPDTSLHVREIARLTGKVPGTLLRELNVLADAGLLIRTPLGNQVHFRANSASPIYEDLRNILKKTSGVAEVLREALEPLKSKIDIAFVYGSIARGDERAGSDMDVMVVGSAKLSEVVGAFSASEDVLRRQINPVVFPTKEFKTKLAERDPFLERVMVDKKLFVIGEEDDIRKLGPHREAKAARGRQARNRQTARIR